MMMIWATHNQSLLSSPTSHQAGHCRWVQLWRCWSGGLPSKTWPTPGWGPPEARLPTPASWTWPVVAVVAVVAVVTLQSSSRLESSSSSQSDPSWLPVFTSFWPNFEIYSTGWIHLWSIVTSEVWSWSLWPCLCLRYFVWILSELITTTTLLSMLSNAGYPHNPYNGVICNDVIAASGVFTTKELWKYSKGKQSSERARSH